MNLKSRQLRAARRAIRYGPISLSIDRIIVREDLPQLEPIAFNATIFTYSSRNRLKTACGDAANYICNVNANIFKLYTNSSLTAR